MCCAFNAESALRKSTYSELVQSMQTLSNPTPASGDEIKKIKTGEQNGLTLWLDQHSDNTSFGTIYDDYNGFKVSLLLYTRWEKIKVLLQVFVGQSAEFPVVRERSVTLQPGREHFLEMAGFMVTTDQQAEALDVKYRYCWFLLVGLQYLYWNYSSGIATQGERVNWSSTVSTLMLVVSWSVKSRLWLDSNQAC